MKSIIIITIFLTCLFHIDALSQGAMAVPTKASYIFLASIVEDGHVEIFNMDADGSITYRSRYNLWNDVKQFKDVGYIVPSPKGDNLFLLDWDQTNGAFYTVDSDLQFHFVKEINDGCAGAGFTMDGEYAFATTHFINYIQTKEDPKLLIFKTNGGSFDLANSMDVSPTATLGCEITCDKNDIMFAYGGNGRLQAPFCFNVYQFNRSDESLSLKQYSRSEQTAHENGVNTDKSILVYASRRIIGSIVRQPDGTFAEKSKYWNSDWRWADGKGVRLSHDGKYAVALVRQYPDGSDSKGGIALFSVSADGELTFLSYLERWVTGGIDISPDGKYFIAGYEFGERIGVFTINREKGILEEIHTLPHSSPGVWYLRFLPQYRPAAAKDWQIYGSTKPAAPAARVAQKETHVKKGSGN